AVLAQQRLQRGHRVHLVVDHDDPRRLFLHDRPPSPSPSPIGNGRSIAKLAPPRGPRPVRIAPPWWRTICCTIDRPRPVPFAFVVTKSWNTSTPSGRPGPPSGPSRGAPPSTTPVSNPPSPPVGWASIALRTRLITTCFI